MLKCFVPRSPLSVIAEPTRQRILQLVWTTERSAGEIAGEFPVSFSAVSQHLAALREAGLVECRREGKKRWYIANRAALGPLAQALEAMWSERLGVLKALAEREEKKHEN